MENENGTAGFSATGCLKRSCGAGWAVKTDIFQMSVLPYGSPRRRLRIAALFFIDGLGNVFAAAGVCFRQPQTDKSGCLKVRLKWSGAGWVSSQTISAMFLSDMVTRLAVAFGLPENNEQRSGLEVSPIFPNVFPFCRIANRATAVSGSLNTDNKAV